MKKAFGTVEMALLLGFVVIISIFLMNIYNNLKQELVNMSKVKTETAGTAASWHPPVE